jgi:hypothetical protein
MCGRHGPIQGRATIADTFIRDRELQERKLD